MELQEYNTYKLWSCTATWPIKQCTFILQLNSLWEKIEKHTVEIVQNSNIKLTGKIDTSRNSSKIKYQNPNNSCNRYLPEQFQNQISNIKIPVTGKIDTSRNSSKNKYQNPNNSYNRYLPEQFQNQITNIKIPVTGKIDTSRNSSKIKS
jgi:hypothetical protein